MFHLLVKGGWVMIPLLICFILAVAVTIERFYFFRCLNVKIFAEEVLAFVNKGEMSKALNLSKNSSEPLARVLTAGIDNRSNSAKAMEAEGISEVATMKRGLPVLDTIITLSPLLGLLGTIVGMINSFHIMAASGLGEPHAVTGGVAEALIATATGISIAVIALIPYNYFLARIERESEAIEHYASRLELALNLAARE